MRKCNKTGNIEEFFYGEPRKEHFDKAGGVTGQAAYGIQQADLKPKPL